MADAPVTTPADRQARLRQARFSPYTGAVTNISRRLVLGATPPEVYRCLTDADSHAALTGAPASPGSEPGDDVSLAGGHLAGLLMEVLEDRHVVFALRLADSGAEWPAHHFATTTFMLRPEGPSTALVLFAQGVPEELAGEVASLLEQHYLTPLAAAFPVAG